MALLGASVLAILVGVGLVAVLVVRFWMRVAFRVMTVLVGLGALAAVAGIAWLWLER